MTNQKTIQEQLDFNKVVARAIYEVDSQIVARVIYEADNPVIDDDVTNFVLTKDGIFGIGYETSKVIKSFGLKDLNKEITVYMKKVYNKNPLRKLVIYISPEDHRFSFEDVDHFQNFNMECISDLFYLIEHE